MKLKITYEINEKQRRELAQAISEVLNTIPQYRKEEFEKMNMQEESAKICKMIF